MSIIQLSIAFLGRALFSFIFISAAIQKLMDWQGTIHYFTQGLNDLLALNVGNPTIQNAIEWALSHVSMVLLGGTIFELVGGLFIFLGIWTRLGSLLLILLLIPTTFIFHHFWLLQDVDRQMQLSHFMKNLSIFGGLLFFLAVGNGAKCIFHSNHAK